MREEELKEINENRKRMERLEGRYEEIRGKSIGSKEISGMPSAMSGGNKEMDKIDELCDIEAEYKEIYLKNKELIRRGISYIKKMPDRMLQDVLKMRYIRGMALYEIARKIRITENDCRVILNVHFKSLL